MPGDRPPGNRKPGQNRGPRNGAGPSSNHSGGATSFTAKQKEDISTIRAFGIEEDKLTDEQIVSHMQSTKCRPEQLVDEFYTKGGLEQEFHTVQSKSDKKEKQRKSKGDRPERPERERRDDNRSDRGDRRAEPRPKQSERRETKPQPRPAQPAQHQASKAAVQNPRGWGNQPPVAQVTQTLAESWPAQEPPASAEPIAAPEPAAPAPAPAPKAGVGGMSWAQRAAPKAPPKPAPTIALPAQPKHVSPPPSPQLESAAAATSAVEEVFELSVEAPSNSTEAEVAPVADAAPVEPVSIGKPAATYVPTPATGSVWGVGTPAAAQEAKDLSTTAPAFEPAEPMYGGASSAGPPGVYPPPAQPAPEISGSNSFGAGPSSAAPFVGQPQVSSFGASTSYAIGNQGGSHGSGYMQSLGVAGEQPAGMGISFGSWGALGATENEPSTSGNGVSSYGADQPAVEIPPAAPQPVRSPPKPEESSDYPSSSNDAAQMAQQNQFMAGFGGQPPYAFQSDDGAQQQYGEQQEQLQYGGAQSYGDDDAAQRYGNGAKKGGAQQQAQQPQPQAKQPVPQQPQQNMQQQQQMPYYGQGMQQFPQGQAMYPYPQPFYGYQFPPGQAGQYQYPAQQQQNMNQMKRGQYSVPPQGGFPQQAQGSQYPYAQQGAGAFDYSQTYSDPATFAGQAGDTAAPAATDKAGQEVPNQQAMYQQFSHAGHAGYPAANNFYYPQQHMQQPTPQQYGQHMQPQQQQQQYWHQQQQQNGAQ